LIGIVIVAHGGLAKEYLAAVEHVVGRQICMAYVAIEAEYNRREKQDQICALADEVDTGDGVVIVTDMFGGSPSNLALPACRGDDRKILYGVNLPVLVKLAKSRHRPLEDEITEYIDAGRQYLDSIDGE